MIPKREILTPNDLAKWKNSKAYTEYINFIKNLNDSVKGSCNADDASKLSDNAKDLMNLLDTLSKWIDETPPIQQPQRFGNKAFRDWLKRLQENANSLVSKLTHDDAAHTEELTVYLIESFGNDTRIDYGTGHEMNFAFFLMCLFKIDVLKQDDSKCAVNQIFNRYVEIAHKLQLTYKMEPAGSHGVWSLDDYQFLPFIFGSSQMMRNRVAQLEPSQFIEVEIIEQYKDSLMFFSSLHHINKVKTGMFAEHSNQLWNISSVPTWSKVNSGLIKMYIAEVLEKFPVAQHIKFGSLIEISGATN